MVEVVVAVVLVLVTVVMVVGEAGVIDIGVSVGISVDFEDIMVRY